MQTQNQTFPSVSRNMEVLLEAFFNVQHNEHMKAWRWHLYTSKYDQEAVDVALREASKVHQ